MTVVLSWLPNQLGLHVHALPPWVVELVKAVVVSEEEEVWNYYTPRPVGRPFSPCSLLSLVPLWKVRSVHLSLFLF